MDHDAIVKALVKGLEWNTDGDVAWSLGRAPRYSITRVFAWGCKLRYGNMDINHPDGGWHPSVDAAQAAAEADYRARVAAALRVDLIEALVDIASDFAKAKIDALRYSPPHGASPEDEPDPVVDAETVWAWQADFTAAEAERARLRTAAGAAGDTFYIDCEFDGHDGPLLSIAMVRGDGWSLHVEVADVVVADPWVRDNVVPILGSHHADISCCVRPKEVGRQLRHFIGDCQRPTIIADSPVDIGRFCRAISTGEDGGWASTGYPHMTFIVRNVDCYPTVLAGAVRHNAWWDAMALRALATGETK